MNKQRMSEQIIEGAAVIGSRSGLHARPAAIIVQKAKAFPGLIELVIDDKTANAKSLLAILTLGAVKGDTIFIRVKGVDASQVLADLISLLEADLG